MTSTRSNSKGPIAAIALAVVLVGITGVLVWSLAGGGSPPAAAPAEEPMALETYESIRSATTQLMDGGELAQAEKLLAVAVDKHPSEQELRVLYGQALLGQSKLEDALQQFQKACFIGPDSPVHRDFAATIAAQLGKDEVADQHYAVAQKLDPTNPKYPLYRAQVQRRLHKPDEARANLVIATSLDPDLAIAWASLGAIALDENRPTATLEYVRKARILEPDELSYRLIECKGLRRLGRAEEAANLLYALPEDVRLDQPAVREELTMCLGMLGRHDKLADLWAEASDRDPRDADAARRAAEWAEKAGRGDDVPVYEGRARRLAEAADG